MATEFNFDGIVGPTHNYAGLSYGNVASQSHQDQVSNPKAAALQGLEKMKSNFDVGIPQAVLPPLLRPRFDLLRTWGFQGSDEQITKRAIESDPVLAASCCSASNMWTANAATISPSADCADGRVHLTPANLSTTLHRSIEVRSTTAVLRSIFRGTSFEVHDSLPAATPLADEGAANHTRLCPQYGETGLEIFTFGRSALGKSQIQPSKFPARQTLEACQTIARFHQLNPDNTFFVQQNPDAIDAGVFHNDVISVGNQNVLLVHELAFVDQQQQLDKISQRFTEIAASQLFVVEISNSLCSLQDAVESYLFNSQILSLENGQMTLVCPTECESNAGARRAIDQIIDDPNPIASVRYLDLRQSMNNGGGPACLRLRVVLTDEEAEQVHPGIIFSNDLYRELTGWVEKNYRDQLSRNDLFDPALPVETRQAISELAALLDLPQEILLA